MKTYRTVQGTLRHETDKIKGSRFIATVAPISSEEEVRPIRRQLAEEFPDANHHCLAWRLAPDGAQFRAQDDGEPSGSAGTPILRQLESRQVCDALVVVTRIFGGVKLGVGGLIRAYGGAAAEALDRARLVDVELTVSVEISLPYEFTGPVKGLFAAHGLIPERSDYGETVSHWLRLAPERCSEISRELQDRTAGKAEMRVHGSAPRVSS